MEDTKTKKKSPVIKQLNLRVYPSDVSTVAVTHDDDYGGAHLYHIRNSEGRANGESKYAGSEQKIQFVKKDLDGTIVPGLQDEQVILVLIDRLVKLNNKFPSREGSLAITKLQEALHWLEARVKEREERGVLGDLKG